MDKQRRTRLAEFIEPFRVEPGASVRLSRDFDPAYKAGWMSKEEGRELLEVGVQLLAEYQARLAAQDTYGLLVVLQAMDAAGKDGTIRHVMSGMNPQGVVVTAFKVPEGAEKRHDYLWRVHQAVPEFGQIGIFNRSHYEEVLVVRVHPELLAKQRIPGAKPTRAFWKQRYEQINDWERRLDRFRNRLVLGPDRHPSWGDDGRVGTDG